MGSDACEALGYVSRYDSNMERMVCFLTSLVGHRVTARLENNTFYEGTFHSCAVGGDYSICLTCARRLPTKTLLSGEVLPTVLISFQDVVQISALDVPPLGPPWRTPGKVIKARGIFPAKAYGRPELGRHELVKWVPDLAVEQIEEPFRPNKSMKWDQFKVNESLFGVTTTYDFELYTTVLDISSIPTWVREQAEIIATEIERENASKLRAAALAEPRES